MSPAAHEGPSWLLLERYVLGELSSRDSSEVERLLGASQRARAMLSAIASDVELPPLLAYERGRVAQPDWRRPGLAFSTALVAALALLCWRAPERELLPSPSRSPNTKGDVLALSLFSELTGSDPRSFVEGERFKLFYTCPPGLSPPARVLVFQAGARHEPLQPLALPVCSNQQPWPGAFSLTGSQPVQVCVAWGEAAVHARSPAQLAGSGVCSELAPAR